MINHRIFFNVFLEPTNHSRLCPVQSQVAKGIENAGRSVTWHALLRLEPGALGALHLAAGDGTVFGG